jgi:hypothetical protein
MIIIKEVPVGEELTENTQDDFITAASGCDFKEALENLLNAINQDYVDTENCFLQIIETKD